MSPRLSKGGRATAEVGLALVVTAMLAGCGSESPSTTVPRAPELSGHSKPSPTPAPGRMRPTAFFAQQTSPTTAATTSAVVGTDQILSFDVVIGEPDWEADARELVQNGVWTFSSDGNASFDTVGVLRGVYPLRGEVTFGAETVSFDLRGSASQPVGGLSGTSLSLMAGTIDLTTDPETMDFTWINTFQSSGEIGDTPLTGTSTSEYRAEISLRPG